LELAFQFCDFSTAEFKKEFRLESLESKTKLEFRFQWGSQKFDPKIGIPPNQACMRHSGIISAAAASMAAAR
jgi:hypothetical protein